MLAMLGAAPGLGHHKAVWHHARSPSGVCAAQGKLCPCGSWNLNSGRAEGSKQLHVKILPPPATASLQPGAAQPGICRQVKVFL